MKIISETERLLLREFELSDWQFFKDLVSMPTWIQFIGDRNVHSKNDAENYILKLRSSYQKDNFGFWLVELNDAKTPIGMCGFIKRKNLICPILVLHFLKLILAKALQPNQQP